jgi:hypothetical protein
MTCPPADQDLCSVYIGIALPIGVILGAAAMRCPPDA